MQRQVLPYPLNDYADWSKAEVEKWYKEIVEPPSLMQIYDGVTPALIYGIGGSGITTTLRLIAELERSRGNFVVLWDPQPETTAFPGVVRRVIEGIAKEIIRRSRAAADDTMSPFSLPDDTIALWYSLLTTYLNNGDTAVTRWWFRQYLGMTTLSDALTATPDPSQDTNLYLLMRLMTMINALGYKEIVCFTDGVTEATVAPLQEWFRDPTLQEFYGFRAIAGVRETYSQAIRANGRIQPLHLVWEWAQLWQICTRLVTTALKLETAIQIPPVLQPVLEALITEELGQTAQAIKTLAITLYWLYQHHGTIPDNFDIITRDLYERHIGLCYDHDQRAIYRGLHCLKGLNDIYLDVFEYLYQQRNAWVSRKEMMAHFKVKTLHLDKIISRIRAVIEPKFQEKNRKQWVYLHNIHSWGYELRLRF